MASFTEVVAPHLVQVRNALEELTLFPRAETTGIPTLLASPRILMTLVSLTA